MLRLSCVLINKATSFSTAMFAFLRARHLCCWTKTLGLLSPSVSAALLLLSQAVQSGLWELPPTSLPDAHTWPTWGALRERVLTATKQINILGSAAVRDAFLAELVKLSPPQLHTLVSARLMCAQIV